MNAPYFIEILSYHDEVLARHRFDALPIHIGRAYDNDLILDDAFVAPYHAKVQLDDAGSLEIADVGSKNGIVYQHARQISVQLQGSEILKLGHTNLRVRTADFAVPAEQLVNNNPQWEGLKPALVGLALATASALFATWISVIQQTSAITYLFALLMMLAMLLIWSGCWAFANRVLSGKLRFGRHLLIAAIAMVAMDVWDLVSISLAYIFSLEFLSRYGSHMYMVIAGGMLFYHLHTINQQHPKRLMKISAALALLGSSIILMSNYQRSGSFADELYMSELLPPSLRLSGNQNIGDFMQDAQTLKSASDIERLKPPKNNSGVF